MGVAIHYRLSVMVNILLNHQADLIAVSKGDQSDPGLALTVPFLKEKEVKKTAILELIFKYGMKSKDTLLVDYFKLCKAIVNENLRAIKRLTNNCKDVSFPGFNTELPVARVD